MKRTLINLKKNTVIKWAYLGTVTSIIAISMISSNIYPAQASQGMNVEIHTEEEIKEYAEKHSYSEDTSYIELPDLKAPYSAGRLSSDSLNSALNFLNLVRYVAGIPYNVQLDDEYTKLAQTGTMLNAVNGKMEHNPSKPADMDEELYQLGYKGTSSSNLGWGYGSLVSAIKNGWIEDGDANNIDRVGHRRWVLNPTMKKTGFGKTGIYTSMYVFDSTFEKTDQYGVVWPAQVMPTELFGKRYPWSISMGYNVDYESVNVKLTYENTGKVWNFSSSGSDGEFYVDNQWYGQPGCIIFRPDDILGYNDGDRFKVEISGLKENVEYEVKFFDLYIKYGDANKDGIVNSSDAVLMKKYLAGYKDLEINLEACDVNLDGVVTSADVVLVLKKLAGYDVVLGK